VNTSSTQRIMEIDPCARGKDCVYTVSEINSPVYSDLSDPESDNGSRIDDMDCHDVDPSYSPPTPKKVRKERIQTSQPNNKRLGYKKVLANYKVEPIRDLARAWNLDTTMRRRGLEEDIEQNCIARDISPSQLKDLFVRNKNPVVMSPVVLGHTSDSDDRYEIIATLPILTHPPQKENNAPRVANLSTTEYVSPSHDTANHARQYSIDEARTQKDREFTLKMMDKYNEFNKDMMREHTKNVTKMMKSCLKTVADATGSCATTTKVLPDQAENLL